MQEKEIEINDEPIDLAFPLKLVQMATLNLFALYWILLEFACFDRNVHALLRRWYCSFY